MSSRKVSPIQVIPNVQCFARVAAAKSACSSEDGRRRFLDSFLLANESRGEILKDAQILEDID
jgi:hypothetical protein